MKTKILQEKPVLDILTSLLFAIVFTALVLKFSILELTGISSIVSLNLTVLSLLITLLAIMYTFESQFEENRAIKILESRDRVQEIYESFIISTKLLFVTWVFLLSISSFNIFSNASGLLKNIFDFLVIFSIGLIITRSRRCFLIFAKVERLVREYKEDGT